MSARVWRTFSRSANGEVAGGRQKEQALAWRPVGRVAIAQRRWHRDRLPEELVRRALEEQYHRDKAVQPAQIPADRVDAGRSQEANKQPQPTKAKQHCRHNANPAAWAGSVTVTPRAQTDRWLGFMACSGLRPPIRR